MTIANLKQSIMCDIKFWVDIEKVTNSSPQMKEAVANITRNYHTINIADAMRNLTQVGSLLQLAYAGAKDFSCCAKVIGILADYQSLIKNSYAASTNFVDVSLTSLKYHKFALRLADNQKFDKAMEAIAKTGEAAGEMAILSQNLVDESQKLCDKSTAALVNAVEDETVTSKKKDDVKKAMAQLQAQQAALKVKQSDLIEAVADAKDKEIQAEKDVKDAQQKAFALAMVSGIMQPLSQIAGAFAERTSGTAMVGKVVGQNLTQAINKVANARKKANEDLNKAQTELSLKEKELKYENNKTKKKDIELEIVRLQADVMSKQQLVQQQEAALQKVQASFDTQVENSQSRLSKIADIRAAVQKELRQANADLAEAVSRLSNSKLETDNLDKAIASLEVAVKTLGKIKTIFENACLFWMGVQKHCKKLTDVKLVKIAADVAQFGLADELTKEIINSGLSWLTLSKINRTAALAIRTVNNHVDQLMTNLPSTSESIKLVDELSKSMLDQLNLENENLQDQTTKSDNNNE